MKQNKHTLWISIVLILLSIGFLFVIFIQRGEKENSAIPEPGQKNGGGQEDVKSVTSANAIPNFGVTQVSASEWNIPVGLPYSQVPGANLGATSFEILDEKRIAFLCNSTSEIVITDKATGKSVSRFPVSFAPRDFDYDKGIFYVLSENEVTLYDEQGNEKNKYPLPASYKGVEKLMRNNNATWLLLPSGNSLKIEEDGSPVIPVEYNGIITGSGKFVTTQITGNNSYTIKFQNADNSIFEQIFNTGKKVAGVFVIGASKDRIVLDIQTFLSENPISVERTVASLDLNKNGTGTFVSSSKVPDCYYVLSNKDFYLSDDGKIYNMMTSPKGVFVFLLDESKSDTSEGYPSSFTGIRYQSNDNLIKPE